MDELTERMGVTLEFIADETSKDHRMGLLDVLEDTPYVEPCPFVFVSNTPWMGPYDQIPHNISLVPPPGHLYPVSFDILTVNINANFPVVTLPLAV